MNRRTLLSLLGLGAVSVIAISATGFIHPALAKGGSDGGGDSAGGGGDKSGDNKNGEQDGSQTEQPGTEAQPEDATECAAGTDCKKE